MEQRGPTRFDRSFAVVLCALLAIGLMSGEALAQADDGPLAGERASKTILDTMPPEPGALSAPELLSQGPIPVSYTGAKDEGSGIRRVTLWVRQGEEQPWQETAYSSGTTGGVFEYVEALGDGRYEFSIVAEDKAGNRSPVPEGSGLAATVLDSLPPVITLLPAGASINTTVDVGMPFVDPGATATDNIDGDISGRIVVGGSVNTDAPGLYTLSYDVSDTAGNAAQQRSRQVEVLPSSSYVLTIIAPDAGSIQALPAPDAGGVYPAGMEVALVYHAPVGSDLTVGSWTGALVDPSDMRVASVLMNQNRTVRVSLTQDAGTVQVAVTPSSGSWVITDSSGVTHTGTGSASLTSLPAGAIRIDFNDMQGYHTPAGQSATLEAGATVVFDATYEALDAYIISAPMNLPGRPGETVAVPIALNNGDQLSAYAFTLGYDAAALSFEGVDAGGLVSAWGTPTVSPGNGTVSVSGAGPARSGAGGGVLATITLRVLEDAEAGESALRLTSASLNAGALPVETTDGSLVLGSGEWKWGDVDGNGRVNGVDANLLLQRAVGIRRQQDKEDEAVELKAGNVKGAEVPSTSIKDAYLIYRFVAGVMSTFPADLDGDGFGPEPPNLDKTIQMPVEITDSTGKERTVRTLGGVLVEPGAEIRVPVSVDSATNVFGYLFEMQYDANLLEFQSLAKGLVAEPWIQPVMLVEEGVIRWASTGAERLSGAGQLSVITFRGRPAATPGTFAPLTLSRAELNDGLMIVTVDAAAGTPFLERVEPDRGAVDGFAAITLRGTNLAEVDSVLIGEVPAPHFSYEPATASLRVITPPQGARVVDVTASALGEASTLPEAFEYYEPDLHIALEPESSVYVGDFFQIPVVLTNRAEGVNRLSFVLNFEPDTFARSTTDAVVLGADGGGIQVRELRSVGAGQLSITLEGAISNGHLCTVNLVVVSPSLNPDSLVFVTDGLADGATGAKSVSGGTALPGRGR